MKLFLYLLPQAETDLDSHVNFLAKTSREKALRFDRAAFSSLDLLCAMPLIGRKVKCLNPRLSGMRFWLVKGFEEYMIFYRVFDNYIEVIRILHSAQDIDSLLEESISDS